MDAEGKQRTARFRIALGSTNQVIACVDIGNALGYLTTTDAERDALQHVRATLLRLVMRKR